MGSQRMRLARTIVLGCLLSVCSAVSAPGALASHRAHGGATAPLASHHAHGARASLASHRAHAAIVGGSAISIEQAPWQAELLVRNLGPGGTLVGRCSASIISVEEVLTAAHCVVDSSTGQQVAPEDVTVMAGTSDFDAFEELAQESGVSQVRVHPYYSLAEELPRKDDVAVLTLAQPLQTGPRVKAIGLGAPGSEIAEGTSLDLTGFGRESPEALPATGELRSIGVSLLFPRECVGPANALFLCASTPSGALCSGDSGSALTLSGAPVEVGVVDDGTLAAEGKECQAGSLGVYANLAAPEIRDFIDGSPAPPQAPAGGGAVIRGLPVVGQPFTCEPGSWSNGPTFTYTFADSASRAVLQQGASSVYVLAPSLLGHSVLCEVQAANAGGTGVGRTPGLGPIGPAAAALDFALPPTPAPAGATPAVRPIAAPEPSRVSLVGREIRVTRSGTGAVRLRCLGRLACRVRLTISLTRTAPGKGARRRTVVLAAASFTIPPGVSRSVKLKLLATGRAALGAAHGRLGARLELLGLQTEPTKPQLESVQLHRQG